MSAGSLHFFGSGSLLMFCYAAVFISYFSRVSACSFCFLLFRILPQNICPFIYFTFLCKWVAGLFTCTCDTSAKSIYDTGSATKKEVARYSVNRMGFKNWKKESTLWNTAMGLLKRLSIASTKFSNFSNNFLLIEKFVEGKNIQSYWIFFIIQWEIHGLSCLNKLFVKHKISLNFPLYFNKTFSYLK